MKRCLCGLLLACAMLGHVPLYGQEKIPFDKATQAWTIPWDADWVTAVSSTLTESPFLGPVSG